MNTNSSTSNTANSNNHAETINDSKLAQFNLFFEYDSTVSDVRKTIRGRAIR